jgi:putative peptidoglycan lipid II flippase
VSIINQIWNINSSIFSGLNLNDVEEIIMVNKIISKGKKIFLEPQSSVLSAATIIMFMVVASRILGLVRQRILANYFNPSDLSLFFAAFRLPDVIFEVLVFGTFSSAFIPVFTKALKEGNNRAWEIAGRVVNIGLLLFGVFALIFGIFAEKIYSVIAPGFNPDQIREIASLARILFAAQGLFVLSYVLTGVLESLRRFLVPALAPVFYNLGIIIGTIFLTPRFGLFAPAIGVVVGALSHLLIQLPLAYKLGFRPVASIRPNEGVKKIGQLAAPRIIDISFDQIGKTVELSLASIISTASYTYFTFANSLQLLPVGLFGTSLAKAVLPTLSRQVEDIGKFRKTLMTTIFQDIFLTAPIAVILIVLRIPIVRLVYGTNIFDWQATIQTGNILSVFALGIVFQTLVAILGRAFFAFHDTKTPVYVSIVGLTLLVIGDFVLVLGFNLPVWALAASFSFDYLFEMITLFILINKKIGGVLTQNTFTRILKIFFSTVSSGAIMYVLLKFFDRSVWVKKLSFLGKLDATKNLPFEKFVLDTRYTINVLILTGLVSAIGIFVYLVLAMLLKSEEVRVFFNLIKRMFVKHKIAPIPEKEPEQVTPTPTDTAI